jgi:hypothetical protein
VRLKDNWSSNHNQRRGIIEANHGIPLNKAETWRQAHYPNGRQRARESETPWTSKVSFAERPELYESLEDEFRAVEAEWLLLEATCRHRKKQSTMPSKKGGTRSDSGAGRLSNEALSLSHVTCESRAQPWQNFPLRTPQAPQVSAFADESLLTPLSSKKLTIPLQQSPTTYRTWGQGWA